MHEQTPAKKAFTYALEPYARPRGKPPTTWLSVIRNDFKELNLTWEQATLAASEEKTWERFIENF